MTEPDQPTGPAEREARAAWARGADAPRDAAGAPDAAAFRAAYAGAWPSFRAFADAQVEALGLINGAYPEAAVYFDHARWARDLARDYRTAPCSGGGVHVFRRG